jgi:hypothetical protein
VGNNKEIKEVVLFSCMILLTVVKKLSTVKNDEFVV